MSKAKTEKMIQALALQAADPGFDEAIGNGSLVGSQNDTAIVATKILIECIRELRISIMDQKPYVNPLILGPHAQVSGLLLHPFARGIAGTWRDKDLPTAQMDEG